MLRRYLIVTSRNNPDRWVFPKGHIDPGETAEVTAEREVLEEAGIEARIVGSVGSIEMPKENRSITVEFFLMQYVKIKGPGEDRKQRWCTDEEALDLLSFDNARGILRRAHLLAARLELVI